MDKEVLREKLMETLRDAINWAKKGDWAYLDYCQCIKKAQAIIYRLRDGYYLSTGSEDPCFTLYKDGEEVMDYNTIKSPFDMKETILMLTKHQYEYWDFMSRD